jgi:hypothetical protein
MDRVLPAPSLLDVERLRLFGKDAHSASLVEEGYVAEARLMTTELQRNRDVKEYGRSCSEVQHRRCQDPSRRLSDPMWKMMTDYDEAQRCL